MITLEITDRAGVTRQLDVPEDINLSLMEILKAADYEVAATCGGIALCATCHIRIEHGGERLTPPAGAELDMIDSLPDGDESSRLACQIRLGPHLHGMSVTLK